MARPSRKTDKRLVQAALELIYRNGFTGLKLRQVAKKAGVNLGLFHYHFGTKDEFIRTVLQETYDRFFHRFHLESNGDGPAWERLRGASIAFGAFTRDNRLLVLSLLRDSLEGHPAVREFVNTNLPRHIAVFIELLQQCRREKSLSDVPLPVALPFLLGAVNMAHLAAGIMEHSGLQRAGGRPLGEFEEVSLSDESIFLRVDMALQGLGLRKEVRK